MRARREQQPIDLLRIARDVGIHAAARGSVLFSARSTATSPDSVSSDDGIDRERLFERLPRGREVAVCGRGKLADHCQHRRRLRVLPLHPLQLGAGPRVVGLRQQRLTSTSRTEGSPPALAEAASARVIAASTLP